MVRVNEVQVRFAPLRFDIVLPVPISPVYRLLPVMAQLY